MNGSSITESRENGARVNVAVDADQHLELVQTQTLLKKQFPSIRCAMRSALADWQKKHRRLALAAATAELACPRSRQR